MYSASCWYYLSDWLICCCYFTSHPNYFNIARRYIPYWTMMNVTATSWKILVLFYTPPPIKKTPQKTPKNSKQPAHILNNDHRKCVTITFYKMYIYILTFMVKDMPCFTTEKINSPVWKTCTASEPKYNNGIYLNIYFNCYEKWHDVRPTLFSGPLLTGDKWGE